MKLGNIENMPDPVLVVLAHPDDLEVHCGGTVAKLIARGKKVTFVFCTSGNRGTSNLEMTMNEVAAIREKEQGAASAVLGNKDVRFLRHDDGDLEFIKPHLREEIVKLIRELTPRTIITHDPYPGNGEHDSCSIYPDHITVGAVTFQSASVCAPGPLFYPEHLQGALQPFKPSVMYLIMSAKPNFFIDITDVWQSKLAAIRKHESQGRNTPENDRAMERINGENGARAGVKFAEAFRILFPS